MKLKDTMIPVAFELKQSTTLEALCALAAQTHEKELKDCKEFALTYEDNDKDIITIVRLVVYFVEY